MRINYHNALPKGGQSPTLSQRPDNVLTLKKNDAAAEYKYIFDAKYRINPAYEGTPYFERYRMQGPEEDDINTMHRYRDAIIFGGAGGSMSVACLERMCCFPIMMRSGSGSIS
jgi:predicted component of viral defense system (DUF524 family)